MAKRRVATKRVVRKRAAPKKAAARRRNPSYSVFDASGKKIATTKDKKAARIMARVVMGTASKGGKAPKRAANPLPVGRFVTVKARRNKNGKIDLYRVK